MIYIADHADIDTREEDEQDGSERSHTGPVARAAAGAVSVGNEQVYTRILTGFRDLHKRYRPWLWSVYRWTHECDDLTNGSLNIWKRPQAFLVQGLTFDDTPQYVSYQCNIPMKCSIAGILRLYLWLASNSVSYRLH